MPEKKKLKKIKSSLLSRSFSLAKMTMNTGASLAGHGLSTLLSSDEEKARKWSKLLKSRASSISSELGELKGSLMKAGQMLSMYGEYFLPPEANALLKNLQGQSPPLDWPAIEKILKINLPPEKLALLEIDSVSIGAASFGQVHRARIKSTNEMIVLKVQYPQLQEAIESDLKGLRSMLGLLKILPKGLSTDALFAEVREMLIQEMDYNQEAEQTELYRKRLSGDNRFIVPRIYPEFSNSKIIASSFETGLRPDAPEVLAISEERRNRLPTFWIFILKNFLNGASFKLTRTWGIIRFA